MNYHSDKNYLIHKIRAIVASILTVNASKIENVKRIVQIVRNELKFTSMYIYLKVHAIIKHVQEKYERKMK